MATFKERNSGRAKTWIAREDRKAAMRPTCEVRLLGDGQFILGSTPDELICGKPAVDFVMLAGKRWNLCADHFDQLLEPDPGLEDDFGLTPDEYGWMDK